MSKKKQSGKTQNSNRQSKKEQTSKGQPRKEQLSKRQPYKIHPGKGQALWPRVRTGAANLLKEPAFYIYLIAVVIYLPWFFPNLSDIAPWDETYYIVNGKEIFSGQLPYLADGPLYNFIAGFIALFFNNSPFWLIHVNSLMRFLTFSFIFIATWEVGKVFKDYFNPVILFGFLFISPILTQNFEYPTDLLFAGLSALAFARMVTFIKTKQIHHVWWASFWLGLGMLTRGDAMIVIAGLTIFIVWFGVKQHRWWRLVMAVLIPFLAVTAGYVLLRGVITGDFETGMGDRSYTAFEQGQEVDLPEEGGRFAAPTESYYVARELFGTPEENEFSVFRAISRNPQAYLSRLWAVIKSAPGLFLTAYYRRHAIIIALLAVRGLFAMFKKNRILAALNVIWVLPLGAGIARTLVRVGYFRLFYFVIYILAIFGLKALLDSLTKNREGLIWAGILGGVLVIALLKGDDSIQVSMTVFLCWLLLAYLLSRGSTAYPHWEYQAMLLLLAASLLLRTGILIYEPRSLGEEIQEKASLALREVTQPGDDVLTCTPSVVFLADRQVANFCGADIPNFESSEAFITWMEAQDFEAIYLDRAVPPVLKDLILDQRGRALTQVFVDQNEDVYIYKLDWDD